MKIGSTLIPLVGWGTDARRPDEGRVRHLEAIRTVVESYNVQAIEFNGDFTLLYPQVIDRGYYEQAAELQEELGFASTLHLPFLWLDGASLNEPIRQATVDSFRQAIDVTAPLNIDAYVLHLWGIWTSLLAGVQQMPPEERRSLLNGILRQAERTLAQLGGLVSPERVCVENLEHFPFDPIAAVAERQGMKICLDVGHLTTGGGDALAFLAQHWEQIGEIHLHDALAGDGGEPGLKDHLALGNGEVDYVAFMHMLEKRGYDQVLILEVNTEPDLLQSLERVGPWL